MTPTIRPIREAELPAFIDSLSTGFLERPSVPAVVAEVAPLWDLERTLAAFDGDRIVGTFRSWGTELTVPGGAVIPAAAVAAVTVLATHRRRGILRAMAAVEHAAIRARGEAVGLLYAAEYPIYGRFGYGVGCQTATWTLDTRATTFAAEATGSVEFASPDDATREALKTVFNTWRLRQPGEIWRRDVRWEFDLGRDNAWGKRWQGFVVLHRDASGEVDGYARFHSEDKWEQGQPRMVLHVDELHALTDAAYDTLWRFLADVDLVATVKAEGRRSAERLPWLLSNARAAVVSEAGDGLWVRLFDLTRALEARSYERRADVVLEVVDDEAPGGRTRIRLDAGPDGARCRATNATPDLTLDVAALGAAYLGGTRLRHAVIARGADEHRSGALAEADALLRTADEPWSTTFF